MPKLVKESDGDEKNCGKKRQQPASSKGKGQKKQKTLAVNTTRKSPRKRIQEEEGGASGMEGEQSEISDAESMASQASKSTQSKPTSTSKSKSSSASSSIAARTRGNKAGLGTIIDMEEDGDEFMEVDPQPLYSRNGKKLTRGEKSRIAAKCRRDKENIAMNELIRELPVNDAVLKKMDKSSVIKLATCFIKLKHFLQKDMVAYEKKQSMLTSPGLRSARFTTDSNADADMRSDEQICTEGESRMMLDALNGFLIFISKKGHIRFVSQSVTDHIGYQQENLIGKSVFEIVHPCDQSDLMKQFGPDTQNSGKVKAITDGSDNASYEDNKQKVFYVRMKCQQQGPCKAKGTGYILVQWSGKLKSHVSNKTGQMVLDGLVCICRPMQTSSVVEIRLDGNMFMSRHDLGMTFTFCDTRILTLIGYEPNELIGKTAYHFHNPVDAPKVSDCHQNLIVKGTSVSKYYRFLGKNENWVWLQTRATIIYNTSNKPQYIVCMNYVISEEEGERYLMLEEHKHANGGVDNACLTLPDNPIGIKVFLPKRESSGPRIIELPDQKTAEACIEELCEENLEKTACLNGELDQPAQTVNQSGSPMTNEYLQTGNVAYQSVGYQPAAPHPAYNQAGIQQCQPTEANRDVQLIVPDPLACLPNEGSPESVASALSPCPQHPHVYQAIDKGFDLGAGAAIREGCYSNQSYSEDGGYESATSPYSSCYMSPPLVSPGSFCSETRSECGSVRPDVVPSQTGSYSLGGYCDASPVCDSNAMLQGGNSHVINTDNTALLQDTERIFEALLETFEGQTSSNQMDMTINSICSTIDNLTSQNAPSVSTHVKNPGMGIQKTRPTSTASTSIKKMKDKSLLRSFLTMPEDDIPKHTLTFLKKAKGQTSVPASDSWQDKCSSSSRPIGQTVGQPDKMTHGQQSEQDKARCTELDDDTLDLQEMPPDITDFALQYLDSLTEAQTQAVIADLSHEVAMDTTDSNFKKEIFNTISCQQTNNSTYPTTSKVSNSYTPSYPSVNSSLTDLSCNSISSCSSVLCRNAPQSTTMTTTTSPSVSSSHDHVYHQSNNKCSANGNSNNNSRHCVRSHTPTHGCHCSQFTQTSPQTYVTNSATHPDYRISELEKHLRTSCETYQQGRPCQGTEEFGSSSQPFLRQLLTGELTKDKYIQMERERCGYSNGIRPH